MAHEWGAGAVGVVGRGRVKWARIEELTSPYACPIIYVSPRDYWRGMLFEK